jgi:hypothetical protein
MQETEFQKWLEANGQSERSIISRISTARRVENAVGDLDEVLDLSRFDAAPLIAFTATKETDYGTETNRRIPPGCGAYRPDQRAYTQAGR